MGDNYKVVVGNLQFNIDEELQKVEVPMEEEILQFFYESREDEVKEEALVAYIAKLISESENSDTIFTNFDYYDLLTYYEDLIESKCEE